VKHTPVVEAHCHLYHVHHCGPETPATTSILQV
jgi:hypothetical protein